MIATLRARVNRGVSMPWGPSLCLGAGLVGAALGAALAEVVVRALPLPMGSLEAGRAAGILSQTVAAGYPKGAELIFLGIGLGLSSGFALAAAAGAALAFAGSGAPPPPSESEGSLARLRGLEWLVLLAVFAFGAQPTPLLTSWAPFRILVEEGVHLAPLTAVMHGGRLFEQIDYLYGPILLAPLLPAYLIEPSVHAMRVATLIMHGAGLALMAAVARPLFRTRSGWIALAALLAWLVLLSHPRVHLTALRSALAFAPLLFLPRALEGRRGGWLGVGGGVAVAVFTSPELLTAALLGPAAALLLAEREPGRALVSFGAGIAAGLVVGGLVFAPIAAPLGLLESVAEKLGAVQLGYLARAFPVPWGAGRLWLGDPFGIGVDLSPYVVAGNGVVLVAAACLAAAAFPFLRGSLSARDGLLLAACITAALLLPKLVSRPGPHQFAKVLPGILVVATALAERAVLGFRRSPRLAGLAPAMVGLTGIGILASSASFGARAPSWPPDLPVHDARLGAIPMDPLLAAFVGDVRSAVDRRLPPGEPVWAATAGPGWNFLLDRPPAHPLPFYFMASTRASRERSLARLRANPPKLVLRQTLLERFEGVPLREFLGPVADHLDGHYTLVQVVRRGPHRLELLAPVSFATSARATIRRASPADW